MLQAERHVDEMSANMIATNLLDPLKFVLSEPTEPGCPRQIFLLTDGSVDNTSAVLSLVRGSVGDNQRIFTLGVGSEAGRSLVSGIARFGRGKAEFVRSGQRLEAPVMRHVKRALQPALSEMEVEWGSAELAEKLELIPVSADPHYPPLFDGERFNIMFFFGLKGVGKEERENLTIPVKISGKLREEKFSYNVDLHLRWFKSGQSAHRVVAADTISRLQRNKGHEQNKKEILDIALKYGIASKFTSLVAVEERDGTAATGEIKRVDVDAKQKGDVAAGRVVVVNNVDLDAVAVAEVQELAAGSAAPKIARGGARALPEAQFQQEQQQQQNLLSVAGLSFDDGPAPVQAAAPISRKKSSGSGFFSKLFSGSKKSKENASSRSSVSDSLAAAPRDVSYIDAEFTSERASMEDEAEVADDDEAPSFAGFTYQQEKSEADSGAAALAAYEEPQLNLLKQIATATSATESRESLRRQVPDSMDFALAKPITVAEESRASQKDSDKRKDSKKKGESAKNEREPEAERLRSISPRKAQPAAGPVTPPAAPGGGGHGMAGMAPPRPGASFSAPASAVAFGSAAPSRSGPVPVNSQLRPLDRFVRMIRAAGNFLLADVASVCEKTVDSLRGKAPKALQTQEDFATECSIWSTALAIVLFGKKFADAKDEWETVSEKARRWLTRSVAQLKLDEVTVDSLIDAATAALA